MATREQIARSLQGLGAGLQGQLPQHRAALAAEEKAQAENENARTKAAAIDSIVNLDHLNNGRIDKFRQGVSDRLENIIREGRDPSHTLAIAELVENGEIEKAKEELSIFARRSQLEGVLPKDDDMINQILGVAPESPQKQVNVLRKTITDLNKDFRTVRDAKARIDAVGENATPASDLALIFQFMRLLDPGSVVRESEFRTAEDAKAWLVRKDEEGTAVPAPIANFIRRAETGALLEDTQRVDFLTQANDLFAAAQNTSDEDIESILQRADQDQIPRARVIGKERLAEFEERRAAAPEPTIEDISTQQLRNMSDEELQELLRQARGDG